MENFLQNTDKTKPRLISWASAVRLGLRDIGIGFLQIADFNGSQAKQRGNKRVRKYLFTRVGATYDTHSGFLSDRIKIHSSVNLFIAYAAKERRETRGELSNALISKE